MKQQKQAKPNWYLAEEMEYKAWYDRNFLYQGEAIDGAALAELARAQYPGCPEVAAAFERVTRGWHRDELYTYFIAPKERKARWNYAFCEFLDHPEWGTLTVDFLFDADAPDGIAIGGIEYLDRVMGYHRSADEWAMMLMRASASHAAMMEPPPPQPARLEVVHVRSGARRAE